MAIYILGKSDCIFSALKNFGKQMNTFEWHMMKTKHKIKKNT